MITHPVGHLTSNYETGEDSNNYKLLDLGHSEHLEILVNLNEIEAYRDMDNAKGYTLDKIGKNVLEFRNGRTDDAYRPAIKIKIIGNLSSGTIEELNQIAEILFGSDFISIQETWDKELYEYESAALYLSQNDNPDMQRVYFEYMKELISVVKAGGVRLYNRIYTEIPQGVVYTGSVVSNDVSSMFVPPRMLADMKLQEAKVFVGSVMTCDSFGMRIPSRTLENMIISTKICCASVVSYDYSYMKIPTAALREA